MHPPLGKTQNILLINIYDIATDKCFEYPKDNICTAESTIVTVGRKVKNFDVIMDVEISVGILYKFNILLI